MADTDSENEGILNNIQRLVIRPPGHTGKAKKGHICFDGGYETMNLGRVDFITNQEYDLFIRPDTANPRERLWFHFTVENTQRNQRVIFNVVNLSKWRTLFADGLTPVVKSTSRPRWQRMQRQFVFYYQSPIHSDHFVLSFAFNFDREDERYSFALAQPYSLSRYNLYLESILAGQHTFLHCETIGRTIQERPLQLLTITEEKQLPQPGYRKRIVFLMGRVHASEAPSSFIMQGLIDFLISSHSVALELRRYLIFKLVPVMNPDGAFQGNTMGNLLGQDLNRNWVNPNPFTHPTVHAVRKIILALDKKGLDLVIDIHSHISLLGLFIVGNSYDDVYRFERHVVFPKIMAAICPDFSMENTIYNDDEAKAGTARRFFCTSLSPEVNSYTLEASLYGYVDPESDATLPVVVPYTDDMYCRIGRNLARSLWDYYKILNIIPLEEDNNGQLCNLLRSFNLHRLRAIEAQRFEAATTFDAEGQAITTSSTADGETPPPPLISMDDSASSPRSRFGGEERLLRLVPLSPAKIQLRLEYQYLLEEQLNSFRAKKSSRPNSFYSLDTDDAVEADDEADWASLSIIELNRGANLRPRPAADKKKKKTRLRHRRSLVHHQADRQAPSGGAAAALSVRGFHLSTASPAQDDSSSSLLLSRERGGGDFQDYEDMSKGEWSLAKASSSYGEAYADPRCEMKKRQQQEIVVSGLAINTTSDISSQEEEDNTNEDYQFLVQSSKAQADHSTGILMSLVEPSVRKIGGGGAVSMSAFQAAAPRPQGLRTVELPKDTGAEHLELWHLPVAQGISTSSSACVMGSIHRGRSRMAMRRQSTRRVMDPSSSLCIGPCSH